MKRIISGAIAVPFIFLSINVAQAAQYRVVELPVAELGVNIFPTAINNSGEATVNVSLMYNPPIDTTLINFESPTVINGLSNFESSRGGGLNDFDYTWLYSYITSNAGNQAFQQISSLNSFVVTEDFSDLIHGFDTIDPVTDQYRNSALNEMLGINDAGNVVGVSQDGFYTLPYTTVNAIDQTYVVNDFYRRGFAFINGQNVELAPPDTTAGGLSRANDINDLNQVVGFGTTEFISDALQIEEANCNDPNIRGDIPVESCLHALSLSLSLSVNANSIAQQRGLIWQVDERGIVTDIRVLGMLIEPSASDTSVYLSSAVAINDDGIAVGVSPNFYQNTSSLITSAAFYVNDDVLTINSDEEVLASQATDINNDNIIVGYAAKLVNGITANSFFVHELDADMTIYPDGFFESSSSVPTAINEQGIVVGYAESEAVSGLRRTEGFVYDYRNDVFQGIGSLLECDSPYTIAQINDINDNNEMIATALIEAPAKNIQGEIILDEFAAQTLIERVVAVKLIPISGGSIENCDEVAEVERNGASIFWLLILAVFTGIGRVRMFKVTAD